MYTLLFRRQPTPVVFGRLSRNQLFVSRFNVIDKFRACFKALHALYTEGVNVCSYTEESPISLVYIFVDFELY